MSLEIIKDATVAGRRELMYDESKQYHGFVDASGARKDSMTMAIAHLISRDGNKIAVLDAIREIKAPFKPDEVVEEFVKLLRSFGLSEITGDNYAGEWPVERFETRGIAYKKSEKNRSEIYGALLPHLRSGFVELLDIPALHAQLAGLERRAGQGGHDVIDHARGSHDDIINSAAGALILATGIGSEEFTDADVALFIKAYS